MYVIDACEFCGTFQKVTFEIINGTSRATCDPCLDEIYYEEAEKTNNTN